MKEARKKFQDLVDRVKSGENISFGSAERIFAEGILARYIENQERLRQQTIETLKAQHDSRIREDEDYYEQEEFDADSSETRENNRFLQLEGLRNVISAVGVKPRISQLDKYVQEALREENWDYLKNVLGLTEEGMTADRLIEKTAADLLGRGLTHNYRKIKSAFPDVELNEQEVRGAYKTAFECTNIDTIKDIREETGVRFPVELCQSFYEKSADISVVKELITISGTRPVKTEALKKIIRNWPYDEARRHVLEGRVSIPRGGRISGGLNGKVTEINEIYGIFDDEELSIELQRRLLEIGDNAKFREVYNRSCVKISPEEIKKEYEKLSEVDENEALRELMHITGVAPSQGVFSKLCSDLLNEGYYITRGLGAIEELSERFGIKPELAPEITGRLMHSARENGETSSLGRIRDLGMVVSEEDVHATAIKRIGNSVQESYTTYESLEGCINEFYVNFGIKQPKNVLSALFEAYVRGKKKELNELACPPSLERGNVSAYKKAKSLYKAKAKEIAEKAKDIKNKDSEWSPELNRNLRELYARGLELEIIEGRGKGKSTSLSELETKLGVTVDKETKAIALSRYIRNSIVNSYASAEKVNEGLARAKEAGHEINVEEVADDVLVELCSAFSSSEILNAYNSILLIRRLNGDKPFTSEPSVRAIGRIAYGFLRNFYTDRYEGLRECIVGKFPELSYSERSELQEAVLKRLKDRPQDIESAKKVIKEIDLKFESQGMGDIIKASLDQDYSGKNLGEICEALGCQISNYQIENVYLARLSRPNGKDSAKALYENTHAPFRVNSEKAAIIMLGRLGRECRYVDRAYDFIQRTARENPTLYESVKKDLTEVFGEEAVRGVL